MKCKNGDRICACKNYLDFFFLTMVLQRISVVIPDDVYGKVNMIKQLHELKQFMMKYQTV